MQVADTGSFMTAVPGGSAQTTWIQEKEWCHPSSPFGVIPVLDTGIQEF
ncbi:hypothetical protein [Wolbachia endosymbiont (group A) of Anomoia purmunda]|nr:hypothetical protein [Wolbachia endosymbiont (group A) of Anomoia purmunda]